MLNIIMMILAALCMVVGFVCIPLMLFGNAELFVAYAFMGLGSCILGMGISLGGMMGMYE